MSLRLKLLLGLMFAIAVVILPFWYITENYISDSIESNYQDRAATALRMFEASVGDTGEINVAAVERQARLLKKVDFNIRNIHFYVKEQGRAVILVSTDSRAGDSSPDERDLLPFKTGKRQITQKSNGLVEIHEPLILKGKVVAVVGAYFNSPFAVRLWRQALWVLAGWLSLLIVAYVIVDQAIIVPIRKLEQATVSVAKGSYTTRIQTRRRDEFGSLAAGFNDMLAALQVQDKENQALQTRLKASFDQAQLEAHTDPLTRLHNRRYLEKQLEEAVAQARALKQPLACVFADLDSFKDYNDVYGHQKGDDALRSVGTIIKACLREHDIAARYGGEEFSLALRNTDLDGARAVADRIRRAVANFAGEHILGKPVLTVSMGIAMLESPDQTAALLINQADVAMYSAKRGGKNCIVIYDEPEPVNLRKD